MVASAEPREPAFHTTALVVWLGAALAPSALTRHPLYLALALGLVVAVHQRLARGSPVAAAWGSFARLAAFFVLVTIVLNTLFGGVGETSLFDLPAWRLRDESGRVLFQVGGPVTLESLVFGLGLALALLVVIAAFATFNVLVDHYLLLRGLPSFLYQTATVVSIALTFIPQMVRAQREIREAHALRGHRVRGLRDLLPLLVTVLAEGLDHSIALAEAMESRGFSEMPRRGGERLPRLAIALGLGLVLAGLVTRGFVGGNAGTLMVVLGAAVLAGTLVRLGRRVRRSRYRRQVWRWRDGAVVAFSITSLLALAALHAGAREALYYQPFPKISWPAIDPRVVLSMLPIVAPAAFGVPSRKQ